MLQYDSKDYSEKRLVKGTRGFIQNNRNLIQNVAFEKGLTTKESVLVNPVHRREELRKVKHKREVVGKITPEMVKAAKDKQKLYGTQHAPKVNESPLRKFWGVLWRFDELHGTNVQLAMKQWMINNPSVKELRTRKRLPVMVEAACKMAVAAIGKESTTVPRSLFVSEGLV